MQDLTGEVALVTGASRGIGRAIALALAGAGADVAVNYHTREAEARGVCEQIAALGRRGVAFQADVSSAREVAGLVHAVTTELGPIGVLVNNAGVTRPQPLESITERDFDEVLAQNLKSAYLVTHAVVPVMRARGHGAILFISSVAAHTGGIVGPHYAASKAGMLGLMHSYAGLLAPEGITANAIAPALIETDMIAGLSGSGESMIPLGRVGTPEEVAAVALLLARDRYITGQTINVDGGVYAT
ncbi:MAG TPA: SDR family oxidoreductase [Polyangia bacterium]|jgi:3-oxoacyl-[acyl-carrier protein] reductase